MPPTPTPSAPSAPSAAPTSAAPAKPSSSQSIEAPSGIDLGDIGAELDALDDSKPKPTEKPKAPPAKSATPDGKKPEDKPEDKPEKKADDKPEEKPKDKPEDKPEEPQKPVKAAALREAYENLKRRVKEEYEPQLNELKAKLKEAQESKQTESLVSELETIKKRRDELEEHIKFLDYQKSSEFQEKYAKPYQEAWNKAVEEMAEIQVTDPDGNVRQATAQDLLTLANLPLGEARKLAREMFGEAADDVMAHRRTIRELYTNQQKALEEARAKAGEREKALAAQRQVEHQQTLKAWKEANEALAKKYPNWFSKAEGDDEGNTLLDKGFALADLHFIGVKDLTPEQIEMLPDRFKASIKATGNLSKQDRIALDALLRNKIASHSRLALKLKRASERIKELEASLAEYEKSTPPAGRAAPTGASPSTGNPLDDAAAELDAIDKQFR